MSVLMFVALTQIFLGIWNRPPASLGELALREAVRRQTAPAPVRSLTDVDLGPSPLRTPRQGQARRAAPVDGAKPGEAPKDEVWWRARMAQARLALERSKLLAQALESRAAALTRDVVNRDDPAQRTVLVAERLRVLEELDLMKKQITADSEAIKAIEDEARREGVPPGWIRMSFQLIR